MTRQEILEAVPIVQDGWSIQDACEWTAAFVNHETLKRVEVLLNDIRREKWQALAAIEQQQIRQQLTSEHNCEIAMRFLRAECEYSAIEEICNKVKA